MPNVKISIEGNIGSCKSSLLSYLENNLDDLIIEENNKDQPQSPTFFNKHQIQIFKEPIETWRNLNGTNVLERMYTNPKRWAFTFNSLAILTMLENHIVASKWDVYPNISILERSIHSVRNCFVENFVKCNALLPVELTILDKWYDFMVLNHDCSVDLIIYLRSDPTICLERINLRGRMEEVNNVDIDYLQNLHNFHEQWLNQPDTAHMASGRQFLANPNIAIINSDQTFEQVCKNAELAILNVLIA